jgi:hypothetical protein
MSVHVTFGRFTTGIDHLVEHFPRSPARTLEKQDHTLRTHCRRLTSLTNAFSKKLENFKAAVALQYAYYNFVKSNIAIRCTPAMAAGVVNTFWTVRDLVEMIEA